MLIFSASDTTKQSSGFYEFEEDARKKTSSIKGFKQSKEMYCDPMTVVEITFLCCCALSANDAFLCNRALIFLQLLRESISNENANPLDMNDLLREIYVINKSHSKALQFRGSDSLSFYRSLCTF